MRAGHCSPPSPRPWLQRPPATPVRLQPSSAHRASRPRRSRGHRRPAAARPSCRGVVRQGHPRWTSRRPGPSVGAPAPAGSGPPVPGRVGHGAAAPARSTARLRPARRLGRGSRRCPPSAVDPRCARRRAPESRELDQGTPFHRPADQPGAVHTSEVMPGGRLPAQLGERRPRSRVLRHVGACARRRCLAGVAPRRPTVSSWRPGKDACANRRTRRPGLAIR
jgi:hypothetical protein